MDFTPSPYNNRNGIKPSYKYKNKRVIWLNSAFADDIYNYNEYLFYVRPFQIYNNSILKPICYINETEGNSLNILKIKDLKYNSDYIWDTDRKDGATILTAHTKVESQDINKDYILTLEPQQVDKITIINNEILETTTTYNSFTLNRRYPPKAYNSFTTITNGKLGNIDCKTNTITLTTADITYGSGTYQIFQSTNYGVNGNTEANRLFDYTLATANSEYHCGSGNYSTSGTYINSRYLVPDYLGEWWVVKFPNPIVMTYYSFLQRTTFAIRSPKNFRVYASNDGFNWVVLHTITNATYTNYEFRSPFITDKTPYTYFGVVVNALMGSDSVINLNEWLIYGYDTKEFEYPIPDNWWEMSLSDPYYNTGKDKTYVSSLTNSGVSTTTGYIAEYGWDFVGTTPFLTDTTYKPMGNQSFTVCVWSKKKQNTSNDWIFQFGNGTGTKVYFIGGYGGDNYLKFNNIGNTTLEPLISPTIIYDGGKWVHLAFTFETGSGIGRLYRNGELIDENILGDITPNNVFQIGKIGSVCYEGIMSDFRIYYNALSPSQITYLYNEKPQRQFPPKTYDTTDLGATERLTIFNDVRCYEASFNINTASYGNGTYKCWYSSVAYTDTTQNRPPIHLFNKIIGTGNPNWWFNNYNTLTGEFIPNEAPNFNINRGFPLVDKNYLGDWITIKLPMKIILKSYNFIPTTISPARCPQDYRIYGSNDGIIWDLIIEEKEVPATEYTTNVNYFKTLPTNTNEYMFYHLAVNKIQITGTSLAFNEWILRGEELQNNFIVGLEIEEQDLIPDNIVSEYK